MSIPGGIVRFGVYFAVGVLLVKAGFGWDTWQYWAGMVSALIAILALDCTRN